MAKPQHFLQLRWLSKDKIIYQLTVQSIANSGLRSVHYCMDSTESKYHVADNVAMLRTLITFSGFLLFAWQLMDDITPAGLKQHIFCVVIYNSFNKVCKLYSGVHAKHAEQIGARVCILSLLTYYCCFKCSSSYH